MTSGKGSISVSQHHEQRQIPNYTNTFESALWPISQLNTSPEPPLAFRAFLYLINTVPIYLMFLGLSCPDLLLPFSFIHLHSYLIPHHCPYLVSPMSSHPVSSSLPINHVCNSPTSLFSRYSASN